MNNEVNINNNNEEMVTNELNNPVINNVPNKKDNKKLIIIIVSILLLISVGFNLYLTLFNNNEVINQGTNNSEKTKKYIGKYIKEDGASYTVLELNEDKTFTLDETNSINKKFNFNAKGKYFVATTQLSGKDQDIIVIYDSEDSSYYTYYYVMDENIICEEMDKNDCRKEDSTKFVNEKVYEAYKKSLEEIEYEDEEDYEEDYDEDEEDYDEDDSYEDDEEKEINSIKKVEKMSFKEAVQSTIEYYDDKNNFGDSQQYVNLLKNANLDKYNESDSKVNIYLFIGHSCRHCLTELSFLASKIDSFNDYANIIVYETFYNYANNDLKKQVEQKLGKTSGGVPFAVVGNKTYIGFREDNAIEMLDEAKKLYESNNKIDVVKELTK